MSKKFKATKKKSKLRILLEGASGSGKTKIVGFVDWPKYLVELWLLTPKRDRQFICRSSLLKGI